MFKSLKLSIAISKLLNQNKNSTRALIINIHEKKTLVLTFCNREYYSINYWYDKYSLYSRINYKQIRYFPRKREFI